MTPSAADATSATDLVVVTYASLPSALDMQSHTTAHLGAVT